MVVVSSSILRLKMVNIKGLTQLHADVLEHLGALEYLFIKECDELVYLWESESEACNILVSLWDLAILSCQKLVSLGEKEANLGIGMKSVRHVLIRDCPRLKSYSCPNSTEKLSILNCQSVASLTFPSTLKILNICSSHNLEASWLLNNFLSSLGSLYISDVPNLRSFPEGCLVHLTTLAIENCDNLESIPEKGFGFLPFLCLIQLHIIKCKNLKSFPHKHLQSLTSLEHLSIHDCPKMNSSFPCGLWPPNLSFLRIGALKKPISEWGLQSFPTSLVTLFLRGENPGVVSFATAEEVRNNSTSLSLFLPPSLTCLHIVDFVDLESLSKCLQHLISLEILVIWSCPKVGNLPETILHSLSCLSMKSCPKLEKRCRINKGNYWPIVSQIPEFNIR